MFNEIVAILIVFATLFVGNYLYEKMGNWFKKKW